MISTVGRTNAVGRTFFRTVQNFKRFSSALPQHIDEPHNLEETPWEFTPESMERIEKIMSKYPSNYKQSGTIPLLYVAQEQNDNWVPVAAMNKIAEILDINPMRVYEVASFYTMFNRRKVGKFHLQVCGTTPCLVRGSDVIIKTLEEHLGIHEGGTTDDGLFTVTEVECLAACANAPMIQVNNEKVYEDLCPDTTIALCNDLIAGTAKVGPQNGRNQSEGIMGRTTLMTPANNVHTFRDLKEVKRVYDAEKAATN